MGFPRVELTVQHKRLAFAAVVATLFLVFLLARSDSFQAYSPLSKSYPSPASTEVPAPTEVATSSRPSPTDFLPMPDAKQFCQNRRWEVWEDRSKPRKIYDLILINTELEWLEIRLGQMYDYVDYFIIVEASMTFQDTPKTLFVQENWSRFERYHSKMIRHTLNTDNVDFENTWHREAFSRNAMYDQVIPFLEGPQAASLGDVILVSDVDEIPRPSTLTALRNCVFPQKLSLHSAMYYYSFQWANRGDWAFPQATFYNGNDTVLPNELRSTADAHLYKASWHCSYCFSTINEMVVKISSFSHSELNLDRFKDPQQILRRVRNGIDMYERSGSEYDRIEDNRDVPDFLRANEEKYKFVFNRDPENANFVDLQEAIS
jgi:beta-1,4-mannosyl-glycoprotein beta-1,4-N-acetylglucosaminyltransferase